MKQVIYQKDLHKPKVWIDVNDVQDLSFIHLISTLFWYRASDFRENFFIRGNKYLLVMDRWKVNFQLAVL